MHFRLLAITAALCAAQAGAAPLQPAEAGLQPLYDRVAAIQTEEQAIHLKLQQSGLDADSRATANQRLKTINAEKLKLEKAIEKSKASARSPLVTFAGSAKQDKE